MKKLNYKLIVSDFDGTLLDDNQKIPQIVKESINEYISNGGVFAVCTGRMLCCILSRVRELGLKGLVVAYQGAVIADIESGNIIKFNGMKSGDVAEICSIISEMGQFVNVYAGDDLFTDIPEGTNYLKVYEDIVGIKSKHIKGNMAEFVLKNQLFCQKVSILVAPDAQNKLYNELSDKLYGRFDVTCSAKVLIEVSAFGETKGKALEFLCKYYNIPQEKSVAMGDNLNDLSMIEAAGLGVAVGNAHNVLKKHAQYVSVSNNDGAVAEIINKYGFA